MLVNHEELVAEPARKGWRRQHFLLRHLPGRELSPLNRNRHHPAPLSGGYLKKFGGITPAL